MNMRHLSHEGHSPKEKNVYEEAKVSVKIETLFFVVFKPDYRNHI